jgi:tRNA (guanosine-2'-O-)-methyltransferase
MSSVCSIDVMTPERFSRLKQALARRQHDLTVIADGVHKDHNVSAIIRTCDAVGIARLHVVSAERFRRHHMIAGGSRRWVDVEVHPTAQAAHVAVRTSGMRIVAAHAGESAIDFREFDYTAPTAIVLGSELTGPTPYAIEHADASLAIPMHGLVESLNVSVAAAIILMEAERQRTAAGLYSRPPSDPVAFEHKLFEWAYPDIALRCRERGCEYPPLDDDGQLTRNPFD